MDWCAFRIVGSSDEDQIIHNKTHSTEKSIALPKDHQWESMARDEVPKRNYIDEFAFAIAIPGMLLTILIAILSAVLCFYHDKM